MCQWVYNNCKCANRDISLFGGPFRIGVNRANIKAALRSVIYCAVIVHRFVCMFIQTIPNRLSPVMLPDIEISWCSLVVVVSAHNNNIKSL